jgi:hypothetical protein
MEGVKNCRTYVSRSPDGPFIKFVANTDGGQEYDYMIGDTINIASGAPVAFKVEVKGAEGGKLKIIKNGEVIQTIEITQDPFTYTFVEQPDQQCWYRVDVYEKINWSFPNIDLFSDLVFNYGTYEDLYVLSNNLGFVMLISTDGIPTIILPDEIDKVLNLSFKESFYAMGALTSPIFIKIVSAPPAGYQP